MSLGLCLAAQIFLEVSQNSQNWALRLGLRFPWEKGNGAGWTDRSRAERASPAVVVPASFTMANTSSGKTDPIICNALETCPVLEPLPNIMPYTVSSIGPAYANGFQ